MHHNPTPLIVEYSLIKRLFVLVVLAVLVFLLIPVVHSFNWLSEDILLVDLLVIPITLWGFNRFLRAVCTQRTSFYDDRIEQQSWLGNTLIPTYALLIKTERTENNETIRLFHGHSNNYRESIVMRSDLIKNHQVLDWDRYLRKTYQQDRHIGSLNRSWHVNLEAFRAFDQALNNFWVFSLITGAISWVVFLILRSITNTMDHPVWNLDPFNLAQSHWHIVGLLISVAVYFWVKKVCVIDQAHPRYPAAAVIFISSLLSLFAILLYGEFGDRLDFYAFTLTNYWMLADFYPRLSAFEALARVHAPQIQHANLNARPRRSLQVSLALLGGLSVLSNTQSLKPEECKDSQGQPINCDNNSSGGSSGSGSSRRSTRSGTWHHINRGGFGGSSFHFSSGS